MACSRSYFCVTRTCILGFQLGTSSDAGNDPGAGKQLGLHWGSFEKGATIQSAHAVLTICVMLFLGKGGLLLLALAIAQTLKLDKRNHSILVAEIERLQNGGDKTTVTAETREVVEDLTGYPYEEL